MPSCVHTADDLIEYARKQVDYVLGDNPKGMSYMVGFGDNYPRQLHHRGSSLPSVWAESEPMFCKGEALTSHYPNVNTHVGAIVGGPNKNDEFDDDRQKYEQSEPATYINAAFVGIVASLLAQ
ncbi:unnamed protein product [Cuscuta epithymum]|uniref:Endoglucanase n=1 Tax=Cuscuta epithymum TaxID=186058 RepID=A0AAV0E5Z0_9ASTE|nr:unnamed protein product [Cuscuta epithymum]